MSLTVIVAVLAGTACALVIMGVMIPLIDRRVSRVLSTLGNWRETQARNGSDLRGIADNLKSLHSHFATMERSLVEERQRVDRVSTAVADATTRSALNHSAIISTLRGMSSRIEAATTDVRDTRGEIQHCATAVTLLSGSLSERTAAVQAGLDELASSLKTGIDGLRDRLGALATQLDAQGADLIECTRAANRRSSVLDDLNATLRAQGEDIQKHAVGMAELSAAMGTVAGKVNASRDELEFLLHSGLAQVDDVRQAARRHQDELSRCTAAVRELSAAIDSALPRIDRNSAETA
jgi:chromosome segregation ATPase